MSETNSKPLAGLGKSVFLGGGAAGILSIFPGLNLLNLFFMLWIVLGAGLTIFLLQKENPELKKSDALLAGALSGLTGGAIFALVSIFTITGITQEQLDQMIESAQAIAPWLKESQASTLASGQFKTIMIISSGVFVLVAIAAGALAGLIARKIFLRPRGERP